MKNSQSGFTLIEIMVVVMIIGLLAAVVAPNVIDVFEGSQRQVVRSDFLSIETALKMYKLDNSIYPNTEQGLKALVFKPQSPPEPKNWRASGYLDRLPMDPWKNPYVYMSPGEERRYDIYSLGADGVSGGEEEAADISLWTIDL